MAPCAADSDGADDQDPLDHLPPLDLPGEVTRSAVDAAGSPGGCAGCQARRRHPPPKPDAKTRKPAAGGRRARSDLDRDVPAPEPAPSASVGPGIARFVAVDLKLAGGSAPLRPPASNGSSKRAIAPSSTSANPRRSRLRSSPKSPTWGFATSRCRSVRQIDRSRPCRPIQFRSRRRRSPAALFFDSDGTRAGALWYIRRIANDRVDQQIARREAEELGLTDQGLLGGRSRNMSRALGRPRTTANSTRVTAHVDRRRRLRECLAPIRNRSPRDRHVHDHDSPDAGAAQAEASSRSGVRQSGIGPRRTARVATERQFRLPPSDPGFPATPSPGVRSRRW